MSAGAAFHPRSFVPPRITTYAGWCVKNSRPKPHRHFTGQFTADAAHRHAHGRPCQFLQKPPIRRLGALRIVGSWRLKPCRKAVSKTHDVARRNRHVRRILPA